MNGALVEVDRYSRQILFEPIGPEGQEKLTRARVVLMGCGALGTVLANTLVRAGVGFTRICDRDHLEPNNLQRQVLFDEDDIARNLPKAIAAAEKLRRINSAVVIEPVVTDVNHTNIERLLEGADVILDGTDNFETRYLINDAAIKQGIPWVYGAVIGSTGLVMPILANEGPCLRCVFESAPPAHLNPSCDTAGVIGPAVNVVASLQAVAALKLLCGRRAEVNRSLTNIDVWSGRVTQVNVSSAKVGRDCRCCGQRDFEYLRGRAGSSATTLCGRDAVQINPPAGAGRRKLDFAAIAEKMKSVATGPVTFSRFMLQAEVEPFVISVFPDGRAIIKGTKNPEQARTAYAKYVGH